MRGLNPNGSTHEMNGKKAAKVVSPPVPLLAPATRIQVRRNDMLFAQTKTDYFNCLLYEAKDSKTTHTTYQSWPN